MKRKRRDGGGETNEAEKTHPPGCCNKYCLFPRLHPGHPCCRIVSIILNISKSSSDVLQDLSTFWLLVIHGILGQSHGICSLTPSGKINTTFTFLVKKYIYLLRKDHCIFLRNNNSDHNLLLDRRLWISVH